MKNRWLARDPKRGELAVGVECVDVLDEISKSGSRRHLGFEIPSACH